MDRRIVRCLAGNLFLLLFFLPPLAGAGYITERISNPGAGKINPDGLEPGGDRSNSHVWAMDVLQEADGEYLYVGSNRDLIYRVMAGYLQGSAGMNSSDANDLIKDVFQGDIAVPDHEDNQGRVFRYPVDGSGPWEEVYRGDYDFRGAVAFTDSDGETALYMVTTSGFGSVDSRGNMSGRVLKFRAGFRPGDTPKEVLRVQSSPTIGSEGPLRAIAVHEGHLVVGTFDNRIYATKNPKEQSAGDDTAHSGWIQIADVSGGNLPADKIVWDLLSYNGFLYAFLADHEGFGVYKGSHPNGGNAGDGWLWEAIVDRGARYPAGMGDPYNNATSAKVFKDRVYVGTLTQVHLSFIAGTFSAEQLRGGQVYRFDREDNWELVIGDPDRDTVFSRRKGNYGPGFYNPTRSQQIGLRLAGYGIYADENLSANQYIWWMEVHEGKLWASTFDISVFFRYLNAENLERMGLDIGNSALAAAISELDAETYEQITENPPGFDLYVSSDGTRWQPVVTDGFGDPYNYGGRVMKSTDEGLFVGTANPFWGCQVWLVNEGDSSSGGCFLRVLDAVRVK